MWPAGRQSNHTGKGVIGLYYIIMCVWTCNIQWTCFDFYVCCSLARVISYELCILISLHRYYYNVGNKVKLMLTTGVTEREVNVRIFWFLKFLYWNSGLRQEINSEIILISLVFSYRVGVIKQKFFRSWLVGCLFFLSSPENGSRNNFRNVVVLITRRYWINL